MQTRYKQQAHDIFLQINFPKKLSSWTYATQQYLSSENSLLALLFTMESFVYSKKVGVFIMPEINYLRKPWNWLTKNSKGQTQVKKTYLLTCWYNSFTKTYFQNSTPYKYINQNTFAYCWYYMIIIAIQKSTNHGP